MKNNITELVFILDRSGSMHGLEVDTIGGYLSVDAGHVPQKDEEFRIGGWIFTITAADAKQIHTVLAQREA